MRSLRATSAPAGRPEAPRPVCELAPLASPPCSHSLVRPARNLSFNNLSGAIPIEVANLTLLETLDLGSNSLTGPIPTELGKLNKLTTLNLNGNALTGAIPPELSALLPGLTNLRLSDNKFTPEAAASKLSQACFSMPICRGLPPDGCSAFGEDARASAMEAGKCFMCPRERAPLYLAFAAILIGGGLALFFYLRLVHKYPDSKGWIATSSLVLSELQVLSVLATLKSTHGSTAAKVASSASLFSMDFTIAQPECLTPQGTKVTYIAAAIIVGTPALVYVGTRLMRRPCSSALTRHLPHIGTASSRSASSASTVSG